MGCGAAFFDYDHDGWLDIFLVNGSSFDPKVRDRKPASYLFHNNRDGTFTDVTQKAGLTHSGWGQACCVGDYDNDGFDDLFVTYWGHNVLYRNNGDGTFTDVSEKAGVAGSGQRWGAGCCFLDYDRDGHLDLFVASYVNFDPATGAAARRQSAYCRYNDIPVPCGPLGFAGGTNILYRNRGDGTFADVSEASGIARPRGPSSMVFVGSNWRPTGSYGMGAAAADFDNDGWPDIYVACDSAPSLLYRNNHDGTFREIAVPAGCALDENGVALVRHGRRRGRLRRRRLARYRAHELLRAGDHALPELRRRRSRTPASGPASASTGSIVGFGVDFFDFDNDGWKDIFIANGHVYSQIAEPQAAHHLPAAEAALSQSGQRPLRGRVRARRARRSARRTSAAAARSAISTTTATSTSLVNNLDGPPTLLRNDGGNRQQLDPDQVRRHALEPVGDRDARQGHAAATHSQIDEVMSGSSYYSQNDFRLHFGLGRAAKADTVELAWPSGVKETFRDLPANHLFVIQESKGIVSRRKFG